MANINQLSFRGGRIIKEDGTFINEADIISNILTPNNEIRIVNTLQRAVQDGTAFLSSDSLVGLASATSVPYLFITGAKEVHLLSYDVSLSQAPADIALYENPIASANGTLIASFNKNRNSTITALSTIYKNPTYTNIGTYLDNELIVEVTRGRNVNAGSGIVEEWVLKPNTQYNLTLDNQSGAAINYNINFVFYEI